MENPNGKSIPPSNPNVQNTNGKPGPSSTPTVQSPNAKNGPSSTPTVQNPNGKNSPSSTPNVQNPNGKNGPSSTPNVQNPNGKNGPSTTPTVPNPNGKSIPSATPTVQNPRKSSLIEHEYMFATIPQGRPLTKPTPSEKVAANEVQPVDENPNNQRGSLVSTQAQRGSVPGGAGDHELVTIHGAVAQNNLSKSKAPVPVKDVDVTRHELYKEAVYTCAHYLGTPSPQRFPAGQEEMCLYAHEVFSESPKEQEQVLDFVRGEPFPLTIVNCKVRKCSGLQGGKANGFVDPYCVVTVETADSSVIFQLGRREWQNFSTEPPMVRESHLNTKHMRPPAEDRVQVYEKVPDFIKTSVQRHKSDPKWDQRFQCLSLRPSVDKLTVEVWDHSIDDKYVAKAIRNYDEPSGTTKDLEASLKSVHANAERKSGDIFLGKVSLKISEIPCDGSDHWYYLTGIPHTKDKTPYGRIRIQIWLVHAYRHGRHFREVAEPKVILGHLWDWVLNSEKKRYSDVNKWDGSIPSAATCLLFQYALQNGISEDTHAIIRWNAYAKQDLGLPGLVGLKDAMEKSKADEDGKLPPRLSDSQSEVEENILAIVRDKICPIIRNHLREPVARVHEALASYQHCVDILKKYNNEPLKQKILWLVHAAMRMCILEWYQHVYANTVPSRGQIEKSQYISAVVLVIKEVNALIRLGEVKWSPEFWLTASLEYLPIIYDELQKMVIHDVEAICWLFFQFYRDNRKLRKILLLNEESDRLFCSAFFDLYKQAQLFVLAQVDIFHEASQYAFLENYHRWFRPILVLWLGFALIRGSFMICKTINIDNFVQDNNHTMTSSSAVDTANVFAQLVHFWTTLKWPDVPEGYVIINFLMEVMCSYTVLYAELKHAKLDKEGYYDPQGRFTISERLCTVLNNIEHVKEQLQLVPQEIDYQQLIERLEEACGKSEHVQVYEDRAQVRLEKTVKVVDRHIDNILSNVGQRIQKEVSTFIKESFKALIEVSPTRLQEAMEPILAYLEDNIVVLYKSLHPQNFHKILQLLWNLVCLGLHDNAISWEMHNTEDQIMFFERVIEVIPYLQTYFQGGDAGLSIAEMKTPQYDDMYELFTYFTMETDDLILTYFHQRAQFHLNYKGKSKFGSVRVRIGYWNEKLGVEVISASNLTPHDQELTVFKYFHKMHPTSDPMVEVELKPVAYFTNEKKNATQVKWNNLDPVFEESFYWPIKSDDCMKRAAALVFTVKDYDLLSKNAFLGEAIVPLHSIPGISQSPEPQPMNLVLHEADKEDHCLLILQSRKWDDKALQFAKDELAKVVEPVVTKK